MTQVRTMIVHQSTDVLRAELTTQVVTVMDGEIIPWNSIPIHEMHERGVVQQVATMAHFYYLDYDLFVKYANHLPMKHPIVFTETDGRLQFFIEELW